MDEPLFSWVHLSDLNFAETSGTRAGHNDLVRQNLLEDLERWQELGLPQPHALLVTGDIAFEADLADYSRAASWLTKAAQLLGLDSSRIFVVPGNHDVERGANTLVAAIRRGEADLDTALQNPSNSPALASRLEAYLRFSSAMAPPCRAAPFWTHGIAVSSDLHIRLAGLNTAFLARNNMDHGVLRLGMHQLRSTIEQPGTDDGLVIVLGHHPIEAGWLIDQPIVAGYLAEHADLYLSGHQSFRTETERSPDGFQVGRADDAGPVRVSAGVLRGVHRYNFGAVFKTAHELKLRVWARCWSERRMGFHVDIFNVRDGSSFDEHTLRSLAGASGEASQSAAPTRSSPGVTRVGQSIEVGRMTAIAWSPDGANLATAGHETVRVWEFASAELKLKSQHELRSRVTAMAYDPGGRALAIGDARGTLTMKSAVTGDPGDDHDSERSFRLHEAPLTGLAFSPSGDLVATLAEDRRVRVWRQQRTSAGPCTGSGIPDALSPVASFVADGDALALAFDPVGDDLATGSEYGNIIIWDAAAGFTVQTIRNAHASTVCSIAYEPSGRWLASGSADRTVKIWDPVKARLRRTLEGHTKPVLSVAWSPDGRILASRSADAIRLWNLADGECIAVIPKLRADNVFKRGGIAFHPRLRLLAASDSLPVENRRPTGDTCVAFWTLDYGVLLGERPATMLTHEDALSPPPAVVPVAPGSIASAKVMLVGESNAGKSCLACRLTEDRYPEAHELGSTHGMRLWSLPLERTTVHPRRELVFWDMGGQDEYRLVHQLFMQDTIVALFLFDPTRGRAACDEVEAWGKLVEAQLGDREVTKLLIGAKLDQPSQAVDRAAVDRLMSACGFLGYFETSALNGRGVGELRQAIVDAIAWDRISTTTRPELFQRIRDEIERRRRNGEVVLHLSDLHRQIAPEELSPAESAAVDAVVEQLAAQGTIARSRVATGEPVVVLQVQEIERYAGSLILSARNNPRGVAALELRTIASPEFALLGIAPKDRLPRMQERPVLECTLRLLLEHGICFEHEGLLVFPSLFSTSPAPLSPDGGSLPHSVSLYYDFSGAIDNVYASLVAWLVLAREFGRVRLWANRAELEPKSGGLCGLRKIVRSGGFAHLDIYFESDTPTERRAEFVSFVEEHLHQLGVEVQEHVAIECTCGCRLGEDIVRQRIARGDSDVGCPSCDKRHHLAAGAAEARRRTPPLQDRLWALKTQIDQRRLSTTRQAVQTLASSSRDAVVSARSAERLRILHLSDLHFTETSDPLARLEWLSEDLRSGDALGVARLDFLVVSGDFTDRGSQEGFSRAYEFISALTKEFALSAERCILVPGNHDTVDLRDAYDWRPSAEGVDPDDCIRKDDIVLVRNRERYASRFKPFSDEFFHKFFAAPLSRRRPRHRDWRSHSGTRGCSFSPSTRAGRSTSFTASEPASTPGPSPVRCGMRAVRSSERVLPVSSARRPGCCG